MSEPRIELHARDLITFHDSRHAVAGWAKSGESGKQDPLWLAVEGNHRCNCLLWDEEDLARRRNVADSEIAGNKRAIDGHNQKRNDAIERIDEVLLDRLAGVAVRPDAWHSSETAGAMIDRLSILSLKIFHMAVETRRLDAPAGHVSECAEKLSRLEMQRDDLARCFDTLLTAACDGRAFWRVYRQFKMYNDPTLNPYLYGSLR